MVVCNKVKGHSPLFLHVSITLHLHWSHCGLRQVAHVIGLDVISTRRKPRCEVKNMHISGEMFFLLCQIVCLYRYNDLSLPL